MAQVGNAGCLTPGEKKSGRDEEDVVDDGKRKLQKREQGNHSFDAPPAVRFRRESSHEWSWPDLNNAQTQSSICLLSLKKLTSKVRVRSKSQSRADRRLAHWQCGMTQNSRSGSAHLKSNRRLMAMILIDWERDAREARGENGPHFQNQPIGNP